MSIFHITTYDKRKVVKIVSLVDIGQSLIYIVIKGGRIVFGSVLEPEERGYPFITLLLILIMCFYLVHLTLALRLLIALKLEKTDPLTSARNTKVWQNWAIIYLIFLVGNFFSSILSAQSWSFGIFISVFGLLEIFWRLVGIYNVGIYIDDLLDQISYDTPTIKFFSVRFPVPNGYEEDELMMEDNKTQKQVNSC